MLGQRPQRRGGDKDEGEGERAELARQRDAEEEGRDGEVFVGPLLLPLRGQSALAQEVEGPHDERRQHQVADEEVTLLDVEDGEPDHGRGQQALPPPEEPPPNEVNKDHGEGVEQRRDDATGLRELDQRGVLKDGRGQIAGGLEQVERQRAVGEPARVPRASDGEERAEVPDGERHLADAEQDRALVGVVEAAVVPVQPPQPEEERQPDEDGKEEEIKPRGACRHRAPQRVQLRVRFLFGVPAPPDRE